MSFLNSRLRESELNRRSEASTRGQQDGREWTIGNAEASELLRIEQAFETWSHGPFNEPKNGSFGEDFTAIAYGEGEEHQFEEIFGDVEACTEDINDWSYVFGFMTGCVEAWREVKSTL